MRKQLLLVPFLSFATACSAEVGPAPDGSQLAITQLDATTVAGTFEYAGSLIEFRSESPDQQRATLHLDVNGAQLDMALDLAGNTYSEDGHLNTFYRDDLVAITALRDALAADYPELVDTLHGKVLVRHADRLAEAPIGITFDRLDIDITAVQSGRGGAGLVDRADADGCGGDGSTCLWGENGWDYAIYDPGNDGQCQYTWTQYGEDTSNCTGRCGAGCNHWFDDDYTWDCLDHDRCVTHYGGSVMSGNANCGDEFWDAADDYVVTYGSWC